MAQATLAQHTTVAVTFTTIDGKVHGYRMGARTGKQLAKHIQALGYDATVAEPEAGAKWFTWKLEDARKEVGRIAWCDARSSAGILTFAVYHDGTKVIASRHNTYEEAREASETLRAKDRAYGASPMCTETLATVYGQQLREA